MITKVIARKQAGTCSLTGKQNTEVFLLQANGGETQAVCTARLIEILRWNCAVGAGAGAGAERRAAMAPTEASTKSPQKRREIERDG